MTKLEKRIQVGACSASVFVNEVETSNGKASIKNVVLQRTYKDGNGDFQNANSFGINEIPKAILALRKAYEWLALKDEKE